MDPRTLQLIQRVLIAAVTIVLALVVITAFMQIIEAPDEPATAVVTTTEAIAAGSTTSTTSAPAATTTSTTSGVVTPAICNEPEPTDDEATVLRVFFPCGANDLATSGLYVYRSVPPTDLVLTTTLREMTRGLEPEESALGYRSPFPDTSDGAFLGVSISEGTAFVEFTTDIFPAGADTVEGAQIFLSTINANVFQFGTINQAEYRLGGSCDAFWQQLGSTCQTITRAQWQAQLTGG